jgi:hypothetical protein
VAKKKGASGLLGLYNRFAVRGRAPECIYKLATIAIKILIDMYGRMRVPWWQ